MAWWRRGGSASSSGQVVPAAAPPKLELSASMYYNAAAAGKRGAPRPSTYQSRSGDEPVGIHIHELRKVFHTKAGRLVAVNSLTLDLLQDKITALLGHNGAGKTTTLNMLSGLFPPTSGRAIMDGKNVLDDMDHLRRELLGICPQHDIQWDVLTVREHLELFATLRGLDVPALAAVSKAAQVGISDKLDVAAASMSGGMRRRLSVAIAVLGDPKVVLLDEPTAGVDPANRRALWDVFQSLKVRRRPPSLRPTRSPPSL